MHGNYPGQFIHLAPLLARSGNNVIFITARDDAEMFEQKNLKIRRYKMHREVHKETHHYLKTTEESIIQGQAVTREIAKLLEEGIMPRIIISHGGNGLGLFIKDLVPDAIHIGYFEWYFRPETTEYLVKNFNLDTRLRTGIRNMPILQELEKCDYAVVPTEWQKSQFPKEYHDKLNVIFDGIDRTFFKKSAKKWEGEGISLRNRETNERIEVGPDKKIISYATRGMEPLRGFTEFMRTLPILLSEIPELVAIIAVLIGEHIVMMHQEKMVAGRTLC